ncbi:hypothetical protein [Xanthocytophaga flava]|nr:hypothetical protein [Xanthocytophaga flavus]MDJ1467667.1 hypothetical protein [Xanthocytophaga flavus]
MDSWKAFVNEQTKIEKQQAQALAKFIKDSKGENTLKNYQDFQENEQSKAALLSTDFFDKQIPIIQELSQYNNSH